MPALFRCRATPGELAERFECETPDKVKWPSLAWPGRPSPVVRLEGEARVLRMMRWGMPSPSGLDRPVRFAERNFFSRLAFHREEVPPSRCLIPLDSFALPEGEVGRRTRSWFGLWNQDVFAWAGVYREFPGTGPSFLGMTTAANALVDRVGHSMPVILNPADYRLWLEGSLSDLKRLRRRRYPEVAMWLEQTPEAWRSGIDIGDERDPHFSALDH